MSVVRLIYLTYPSTKAEAAARIWKEHLVPLMAAQPGCLSAEVLCADDAANQLVSLSEWESPESVQLYQRSPAFHQIRGEHRDLEGGDVSIGLYHRV